MTTENFNTNETVTLTNQQYATVLYVSHFLKQLCALVDESSLTISADSITPLLHNVALDLDLAIGRASDLD